METNSPKKPQVSETTKKKKSMVTLALIAFAIFLATIAVVFIVPKVTSKFINEEDPKPFTSSGDDERKDTDDKEPVAIKADNLVGANNSFTFAFTNKLLGDYSGMNSFISPTSIETAFLMTLNGAKGETKKQMLDGLMIENMEMDQLNEEAGNLMEVLNQSSEGLEISTANSLWARGDVAFNDDYIDLVKETYLAEVQSVEEFGPDAVEKINTWIEEKTSDKIKDMLKELSKDTVLVLVNAIYFNGTWEYEFDSELTEVQEFENTDGTISDVDMMHHDQSENFRYFSDDKSEMIELPYSGEDYAMYVVLPKEGDIESLVKGMKSEDWQEYMDALEYKEGSIDLPKFKYESDTILLNEYLIDLGMEIPFMEDCTPDFTGMADVAKDDCWYISKVLHKAFVEVDEAGTEAAAATAVVTHEFALSDPGQVDVYHFRADKPFFFGIAQKETGMILFSGIINEL